MKAAVWHKRGEINVENVPEPIPKPGEVKIAVKWCGICGTDVGEFLNGPILIKNPPVILGHEYSGEIIALGKGAQGFKEGDRVTAMNLRSCGRCASCKVRNAMAPGKKMEPCENMDTTGLSSTAPGAFAEFLCIPDYLAVKLESSLSWEEGTMINPLSIGIHAIKRGGLRLGDTVAVIGDGTIGQLALQACLASGAKTVLMVGDQPLRLGLAKQCGAHAVFHHREEDLQQRIKSLLGGRLLEVTLDCVGSEASVQMALSLAHRGGRVLLVGIYEQPCRVDCKNIVVQEKNLFGVLSQDYEDYLIGNALLAQRRVVATPLITKKIGLEDLVEGGIMELIQNRKEQLRILVHP
jgi:(R,R)-butanediol dehydrogenase/meso-butanediol dehydrogenase/diacetyl reductase